MKRVLSVLLIIVLLGCGYAVADESVIVNDIDSLQLVIENAEGDCTVNLANGNYVFQSSIVIPDNVKITLIADDVILEHGKFEDAMFVVKNNSTLILNHAENATGTFCINVNTSVFESNDNETEIVGDVQETAEEVSSDVEDVPENQEVADTNQTDAGETVNIDGIYNTGTLEIDGVVFSVCDFEKYIGLAIENDNSLIVNEITAPDGSIYNKETGAISIKAESVIDKNNGMFIGNVGSINKPELSDESESSEASEFEPESSNEPELETSNELEPEQKPMISFSAAKPDTVSISPESDSNSSDYTETEHIVSTVTADSQNDSSQSNDVVATDSNSTGADTNTNYNYTTPAYQNNQNTSTRSITVSVNWNDNANSQSLRPSSVYVTFKNAVTGGIAWTASVNSSNNWSYTWTGADVNSTYSVTQSTVGNYTTQYYAYNGNVYISNTYNGTYSTVAPTQSITYNSTQTVTYTPPQNAAPTTGQVVLESTTAPRTTATPVPTFALTNINPTVSPVLTVETDSTETRSSTRAILWIVLLLFSAGAAIVVIVYLNKMKKQKEARARAAARAKKRAQYEREYNRDEYRGRH